MSDQERSKEEVDAKLTGAIKAGAKWIEEGRKGECPVSAKILGLAEEVLWRQKVVIHSSSEEVFWDRAFNAIVLGFAPTLAMSANYKEVFDSAVRDAARLVDTMLAERRKRISR